MRVLIIIAMGLLAAGCASNPMGLGSYHTMTRAEQDRWLAGERGERRAGNMGGAHGAHARLSAGPRDPKSPDVRLPPRGRPDLAAGEQKQPPPSEAPATQSAPTVKPARSAKPPGFFRRSWDRFRSKLPG